LQRFSGTAGGEIVVQADLAVIAGQHTDKRPGTTRFEKRPEPRKSLPDFRFRHHVRVESDHDFTAVECDVFEVGERHLPAGVPVGVTPPVHTRESDARESRRDSSVDFADTFGDPQLH
jgi:hypothetical protein